jgi:hypothetical protein
MPDGAEPPHGRERGKRMSSVLIQQYLAELAKLRQVGGHNR